MKLWPLFPILLLAGPPARAAPDAAALVKSGEAALADRLWEIAAPRFRQAWTAEDATPELKSLAGVRLAEALIREGNPGEALEILAQSTVAENPEARFWKAQALVAQHRITEATELLAKILDDPASPYRTEMVVVPTGSAP